MITIGCLFLLVGLAGARVDFYASQIFDEFDFKGQSSVSIDGPCEVSCAIYASITQESSKKGSNLLIQLPSGFVSVADLASRIDPTTNEKWPLIVNNTAKLTVVNGNANKDAGPLVLYAFDGRHSDLPSGRAFDADGLNLPIDQLPLRLTVMSARPFTIQQAARDQPSKQGMRATLTGFDGMDDSACVDLYYTHPSTAFNGFSMEVNGPIVSIQYGAEKSLPPLTASIGITNKLRFDQTSFVGSPGAHGCMYKQPYRSSLYDVRSPIHAEITADKSDFFSINAASNTGSLKLTEADSGAVYRVTSNPQAFGFYTKKMTVDWTPNGSGEDFFLVKWADVSSA